MLRLFTAVSLIAIASCKPVPQDSDSSSDISTYKETSKGISTGAISLSLDVFPGDESNATVLDRCVNGKYALESRLSSTVAQTDTPDETFPERIEEFSLWWGKPNRTRDRVKPIEGNQASLTRCKALLDKYDETKWKPKHFSVEYVEQTLCRGISLVALVVADQVLHSHQHLGFRKFAVVDFSLKKTHERVVLSDGTHRSPDPTLDSLTTAHGDGSQGTTYPVTFERNSSGTGVTELGWFAAGGIVDSRFSLLKRDGLVLHPLERDINQKLCSRTVIWHVWPNEMADSKGCLTMDKELVETHFLKMEYSTLIFAYHPKYLEWKGLQGLLDQYGLAEERERLMVSNGLNPDLDKPAFTLTE